MPLRNKIIQVLLFKQHILFILFFNAFLSFISHNIIHYKNTFIYHHTDIQTTILATSLLLYISFRISYLLYYAGYYSLQHRAPFQQKMPFHKKTNQVRYIYTSLPQPPTHNPITLKTATVYSDNAKNVGHALTSKHRLINQHPFHSNQNNKTQQHRITLQTPTLHTLVRLIQ